MLKSSIVLKGQSCWWPFQNPSWPNSWEGPSVERPSNLMQGLLSQLVQWYSQKRESSSLEANFILKKRLESLVWLGMLGSKWKRKLSSAITGSFYYSWCALEVCVILASSKQILKDTPCGQTNCKKYLPPDPSGKSEATGLTQRASCCESPCGHSCLQVARSREVNALCFQAHLAQSFAQFRLYHHTQGPGSKLMLGAE